MRLRFWRTPTEDAATDTAAKAREALTGLRRQQRALRRVRYPDDAQATADLQQASRFGAYS